MSAVLLDHEVVHYEVLGRGRPIFFLHGWVGSWRYWIPTMQAVSPSFRAYALDLWGFGDTAKSAPRYTLEQQVGLLERFMDQMGIGRIAIVGHGLGAVVGLLFSMRYPEISDRVLAVSCPLDETLISSRLKTASPGELADWLLGRTPATEAARLDAPKSDPQALQVSLANLPAVNFKTVTSQLTRPSLFVNGQLDPAVLPPPNDRLSALSNMTHQITFEGSGHFPMLDEASKFNRLLTDFLALISGETPRQLQLKEEWKRRFR